MKASIAFGRFLPKKRNKCFCLTVVFWFMSTTALSGFKSHTLKFSNSKRIYNINMNTFKVCERGGDNKNVSVALLFPSRHYPKTSFTIVTDTPENLRLKQQSMLNSQVRPLPDQSCPSPLSLLSFPAPRDTRPNLVASS